MKRGIQVPPPTTRHLASAAAILERLDTLAERSPVPFLGIVVNTAVQIVNILKEWKDNVEEAMGVAEDICDVLEIVCGSSKEHQVDEKTYPDIGKLKRTLEDILKMLTPFTAHKRSKLDAIWRTICGKDKQVLADVRKKLQWSIDVFHIGTGLYTRDIHSRQNSDTIKCADSEEAPTPPIPPPQYSPNGTVVYEKTIPTETFVKTVKTRGRIIKTTTTKETVTTRRWVPVAA
ncbi:hypothetical protein M422DRAFT_267957 [Sphaerobolus stellatus SS14]|uniref:Uncharacterized protein n=1 Tax=Sphaerobolus stellatus (strain SS14) TaxID=990650 RepID=A0A0C9UNR5_SPHS4|nr:hypothetical protein M422DRAFT_267957 [Sphaerobolus stellatus SS14]